MNRISNINFKLKFLPYNNASTDNQIAQNRSTTKQSITKTYPKDCNCRRSSRLMIQTHITDRRLSILSITTRLERFEKIYTPI